VLVLGWLAFSGAAEAQEVPPKLRVVFRTGASAFVSTSKDQLTGFDVELVQRFLAWLKNRSGQEPSVQVRLAGTVDALLKLVEGGQCDVAIGSITATEAREKAVDFSISYLPVRMVLVAPAGRLPAGPYQEVLLGKRVGAVEGSTNATRVHQLQQEVPSLVPRTAYPGNPELMNALVGSKAELDAAVMDITHFWDQKKRSELVLLTSMGPTQGLGIVFPKGSSLRPVVNAFLEEFLHSPSYFHLLRQYFGSDAADMLRPAAENR
jgi:polar amino acid transport system substrate-binding protein